MSKKSHQGDQKRMKKKQNFLHLSFSVLEMYIVKLSVTRDLQKASGRAAALLQGGRKRRSRSIKVKAKEEEVARRGAKEEQQERGLRCGDRDEGARGGGWGRAEYSRSAHTGLGFFARELVGGEGGSVGGVDGTVRREGATEIYRGAGKRIGGHRPRLSRQGCLMPSGLCSISRWHTTFVVYSRT